METEKTGSDYQGFERARVFASGALAVAFSAFMLSIMAPAAAWWRPWVLACSEAALVGGFADWFAVVALFRHPFGIPIPHTAVIPQNRQRLAVSLGNFVSYRLLSNEALAQHFEKADRSPTVMMVGGLAAVVKHLGGSPERLELIRDLIAQAGYRSGEGSIASLLLRAVARSKEARFLLFDVARDLIVKHWSGIERWLGDELPWFIPRVLHEMFGARISAKLTEMLDAAARDDTQRLHAVVIDILESTAQALAQNESFRAVEQSLIAESVNRISTAENLSRVVGWIEARLASDASLRATADRYVAGVLLEFAQSIRPSLMQLIAQVVRGWDTETLVRALEGEVGRDLQFIRINGTVVGGILGVLFYGLQRFLQ